MPPALGLAPSELDADALIQACAASTDQALWREFSLRFHTVIGATVRRTAQRWGDSSASTVEELVQETYVKICDNKAKVLRNFKPQRPDSSYGYLQAVAANVVHDEFKARNARKRRKQMELPYEDGQSSPDRSNTHTLSATENRLLFNEMDQTLRACTTGPSAERDRTIFWLYYRQGWTAEAIAGLPAMGLATTGVQAVILKLTRQLRIRLATRAIEESRADPERTTRKSVTHSL